MDNPSKSLLSADPLASLSPALRLEVESWVVNSVKVKMIKKLDNLLEDEGRANARKLFLVPVFTISQMTKRIEESAPEMKTFFYQELLSTLSEVQVKFL